MTATSPETIRLCKLPVPGRDREGSSNEFGARRRSQGRAARPRVDSTIELRHV